jgi:hypothetical protein
MTRKIVAIGALALTGGTGGASPASHASFHDEGARIVLTTLAGEGGLRIANPEVIAGRLDAVFADETASTLFLRFVRRMGYEPRIAGREVWLQPITDRLA